MQITKLKISNICSFPLVANLNTVSGIIFRTSEKGTTNIIIGPNGSGKSTVLNVIEQFFAVGLQDEVVFKDPEHPDRSSLIPNTFHNLQKNYHFPHAKSSFFIELLLNEEDINNLLWVQQHRETLTKVINAFHDTPCSFTAVPPEILLLQTSFKVFASLDFVSKTIVCKGQTKTPVRKFIFEYFRYYKLIQLAIEHQRTKQIATQQTTIRPSLKNTFAFLSAYRNVRQSVYGYALCKEKIAEQGADSPFVKHINTFVDKYLGLHLAIQPDLSIAYKNHYEYIFTFTELASGEQAFLMILLTVFGFDLNNGLLIVDEPEQHLHPQSQTQCLQLLQELTDLFHVQIVIATHSPMMVDVNNIYNVIRANKNQDGTQIFTRHQHISQSEGMLLHMLKYDNIAKMFFAQRIIMVEGETDLIFWTHYLDYLAQQEAHTPHNKKSIVNYEIIDIGGKGIFKKWKKLLSKFGIESYYIGDRDNILDTGVPPEIRKRKKYLKQHQSTIDKKYVIHHKTQSYGKFILFLHDRQPALWKLLDDKINRLYRSHIFLMKRGDLETYLGMNTKGLTETVEFCQHRFAPRLQRNTTQVYQTELQMMVERMFGR